MRRLHRDSRSYNTDLYIDKWKKGGREIIFVPRFLPSFIQQQPKLYFFFPHLRLFFYKSPSSRFTTLFFCLPIRRSLSSSSLLPPLLLVESLALSRLFPCAARYMLGGRRCTCLPMLNTRPSVDLYTRIIKAGFTSGPEKLMLVSRIFSLPLYFGAQARCPSPVCTLLRLISSRPHSR